MLKEKMLLNRLSNVCASYTLRVLLLLSFVCFWNASLAHPGAIDNDPFYNTQNQVGACGNQYNFGSCTANDFRITSINLSNLVDSCISDTDYFQADVTVQFSKAQPTRYDVMAYFYRGEDVGVAFNQTATAADEGRWCTRVGLEYDLPVRDGITGVDTGLRTGDIDDEDNDGVAPNDPASFCYDAPSGAADGLIEQTELSMVLPCRDGNLNGLVDIATCTGWANNAQGFCDGPEYDGVNEPQNGTGSKCNCGQFDANPPIELPDLTITKTCAGDGTNGTDAPSATGEYAPGDVVQCDIVISNAGGRLDAATTANQEGFYFVDDYDESNGSISNVSVVNSSGSTQESFSDSGSQLTVYPDDIVSGGSCTISYLYTIDASASFDQASEDIPNDVCPYYYDSTNMSSTLNSEFCVNETITTTPVTLAEFSAVKKGNKVEFSWSTATETNNLGFNLYAQYGSSRVKLNDVLIPSKAINSLDVLDYAYTATKQSLAGAKRFYLEDIDLNGQSTMAGPFEYVSQKVKKDIRGPKTNWADIGFKNKGHFVKSQKQKAKSTSRKGKASKLTQEFDSEQTVTIQVADSGLVRISSSELSAYGFDHKSLREGRFTLHDVSGGLVPTRYVSTSKRAGVLEFGASVERTFYAQTDRFTLRKAASRGAAATLLDANNFSSAQGPNLPYYMAKSEVATDSLYHLGSKLDSDPWMMSRVFAFGTTPSLTHVSVPINNVVVDAGVAANVSAEVLGGFDPEGRQDRIFSLKVGNATLDSQPGSGLRVNRLQGSVRLPASDDALEVTIGNLQTNDFGVDLSYINKVAVEYPRAFVAQDDYLKFSTANSQITVSNLGSELVRVYAEHEQGMIFVGEFLPQSGAVSFAGVAGVTSYHVYGQGRIAAHTVSGFVPLNTEAITAQSLVIAHPQFLGQSLEDYVAWRDQKLGIESTILSTQDIYCALSGCVPSGFAIKELISQLDQQNGLSSVMLVGGDVYDYHDNLNVGAVSFVPTLYARTGDLIGFAPVDALYGDVDNDGVPDVAVGRLPVRTNAELSALLAKSKVFAEQRGRTTAVLTADEQTTSSDYDFANSSDNVANILAQKGWSLNRHYLDDYVAQDTTQLNRNFYVEQARQGVFQALNTGPRLSIYTGHSSAVSWSFANVFNYTAATELTNVGSPSLYLQWGCYNTYYSHPTTETLSHGLLLSGEQGAAVVIGASSLTNAAAEEQFAQLIQEQLVTTQNSVGAAMVAAKSQLAEINGVVDLDILWSVTLLGDPELQM